MASTGQLKQDQVTRSFAPAGTSGQPVPCGEGVPHGKAGCRAVAVMAFPQSLISTQPDSLKANPLGFGQHYVREG